jgi:hypothetical protein
MTRQRQTRQRYFVQDKAEAEREYEAAIALHAQLLSALPGGASLISQMDGYVTEFHDAMMRTICLSTSGTSYVEFVIWTSNYGKDNDLVVTFDIGQILDMNLDFFRGNIMYEVHLGRPVARPERKGYLDSFADGDLEFRLQSSFGIDGFLVARGVSVRWHPE